MRLIQFIFWAALGPHLPVFSVFLPVTPCTCVGRPMTGDSPPYNIQLKELYCRGKSCKRMVNM